MKFELNAEESAYTPSGLYPGHGLVEVIHGQKQALELALRGAPLPTVLTVLAQTAERQAGEGVRAAILLADEEARHLWYAAAPRLPTAFLNATDGIPIAPESSVESCGFSALPPRSLLSTELSRDPHWRAHASLAESLQLKAYWSAPVRGAGGQILGTILLFFRELGAPPPRVREIVELLLPTAALVIERRQQTRARSEAAHTLQLAALSAEASYRKLDAIVHNLAEGIFFADTQGQVQLVNPAAMRMHGFESETEALRSLHDYSRNFELRTLNGGVLPVSDWPLSRVLRGERFQDYEVEVRRLGAEGGWIASYAGAPVQDEAGHLVLAVLSVRNVTEPKRIERALRDALQARGDFLSLASHELKTPLTSLKLQTQSMVRNFALRRPDAYAPERVNRLVVNTSRQVERLSRLVEDMLDFSRIEAGRLHLSPQRANFAEITRQATERLREAFQHAGTPLTLEAAKELEGRFDVARAEQVVTNLLTNALRYGVGRPVSVRCRRQGDAALLSVRDEGIGVAPENRDRIFNRFERAVSADEISGLGLGLYISRTIVSRHGGRIWVESKLGQGSTFFVELPLEGKIENA